MNFTPYTLYLKIAGYAIAAAALVAVGWHFGSIHWQTQYDALVAENWKQRAEGEAAARKAVEDQLREANDRNQHNSEVMSELFAKNDQTATERDLAVIRYQRLFSADKADCAARDRAANQASGNARPTTASGTESDAEKARIFADADAECTRNADRLDALIVELKPQL